MGQHQAQAGIFQYMIFIWHLNLQGYVVNTIYDIGPAVLLEAIASSTYNLYYCVYITK